MTSKTKTLIKDFKDHLGFSHRRDRRRFRLAASCGRKRVIVP